MDSSEIQKKLIDEKKLFPYLKTFPKISNTVFLAPGVKIIGDVEIGAESSVWYNTVIRGDVNYIRIGNLTNIQDCCCLHVTNDKYPLIIGNMVTIGHSVNLHGCTIRDLSLIGIGAIVLDGAIIEERALVAAGSLIRPNFIVPSGKLAAGVPAKIVRDLTASEMGEFEQSALRYGEYTLLTIESLRNNKK
jgi:carbonic anhydrase/acetyltransferase-like protein (isoleucine patch superfamily)